MKRINSQPTIGYMNISLINDWAELPWKGVVATASKYNINLLSFIGGLMKDVNIYAEQKNSVYSFAKNCSLDGLILWKGHLTQFLNPVQLQSFLREFTIPIIFLEDRVPGYTSILYGNYEGIRIMMDHLVQVHGYKKIGFMGEDNNHNGFKTRRLAYYDSLKAYGLENDPRLSGPWVEWIHEYDGRSSNAILDEWLPRAMDAGLEAIICMADPIAWWVIDRMKNQGIRVPEDVAVVAFDAFIDSKVNNPPITTIDPNFQGLGSMAVECLNDIFNGKQLSEKILVPPKLFIGSTCGCIDINAEKAGNTFGNELSSIDLAVLELLELLPHEAESSLHYLCYLFVKDSNNDTKNSFINALEKMIYKNIDTGKTLTPWQDVITILNKVPVKNSILKEKLCHQARVLINNASVRQEGWIRSRAIERMTLEREVTAELLTNFELSRVLDLLERNLRSIGIQFCFLALYESSFTYHFPDQVPEDARLVLAFDESGRINIGPEGIHYPTQNLIPDQVIKLWAQINWTVFALHFREKQIGYIIFETKEDTSTSCEILSSFISSSLQSVILISEKQKARKSLEIVKSNLQKELEVAKKIQQALLPEKLDHKDFDIAAVMNTAKSVGGDYYDIHRIHERDWFIIGDVSGQGIRAGLIIMMVQTSIHLLVKLFPDITPSRLLNCVNDIVRENIKKLKDNKYMTINIINHVKDGAFLYSGAHSPILIYRNKTKSIECISMKGMWIGILDDISSSNSDRSFILDQGDGVILFTDGLLKALEKNGGANGLDELSRMLQRLGHKSSQAIINGILSCLSSDFDKEDMTIIVIKR